MTRVYTYNPAVQEDTLELRAAFEQPAEAVAYAARIGAPEYGEGLLVLVVEGILTDLRVTGAAHPI